MGVLESLGLLCGTNNPKFHLFWELPGGHQMSFSDISLLFSILSFMLHFHQKFCTNDVVEFEGYLRGTLLLSFIETLNGSDSFISEQTFRLKPKPFTSVHLSFSVKFQYLEERYFIKWDLKNVELLLNFSCEL